MTMKVDSEFGTVKKDGIEKNEVLVGEEVDVIIVDTVHGSFAECYQQCSLGITRYIIKCK